MRIVLTLDGAPLFDSQQNTFAGAIKALATAFCSLSDDEQAQFFEEAGAIMQAWDSTGYKGECQARYIGEHMASCHCIGEAGRGFLRNVLSAMDEKLAEPTGGR